MSDNAASEWRCPHCGQPHPASMRRCNFSGQPIEPPQARTAVTRVTSRPDPSSDERSNAQPVSSGDPFASEDRPTTGDPFAPAEPASGRAAMVSLLGTELSLAVGRPLMVGRNSQDLPRPGALPDNVSGIHAAFRLDRSGNIYLCDCGSDGRGSTNGTYVNGSRLAPNVETRVAAEDRIELGQDPATVVTVRFL